MVTARGQERPEFIPYLHAFRGVAITLVMLTHLDTPLWLFNLTSNGTLFFIFISGYLFSHLYNEATTTPRFLVGKIRNLLIPYAVSVLPGLLYVYATQSHENWATYTVMTFATGTGHLNDAHWYVPFISLMFLSYSVLKILQRRPRALVMAAVIWLVIGVFTFRSAGNGNPLYSVLHFGGVFLAGMAMSRYRGQLEEFGFRWFWVIIFVSIAMFLTCYSLIPENHWDITMENNLQNRIVAPNYAFTSKLVLIPAVLLTLSRLVRWRAVYKPLSLLADTSFALFFWHMYVIFTVDYFLPNLLQTSPSLSFITCYAIPLLKLFLCIALIVPSVIALRRILGKRSIYLTGY